VTRVAYQAGHTSTINLPPEEILKRTSILPRDLVSLNLTSREEKSNKRRSARPPTAILPRTDCILLSFGNIRAVAGRDSVYILDAHSPIAKSFAKDLAAVYVTGASEDSPELVFLEAVLRDTVDTYTRRIRIFEPIVDDFLDRATNEVFSDAGVHQLVPLKDALQSFELQVKQSLECLTSLLNDDDLMLDLLLAEQAEARQKDVEVDFARHEHVELMLSVYSRQIHNLQQEIQYLLGRLQSKQEFIALALAGYRNRLVRMNVNLGIVGVSTGVTTAITGLFGMNLIHGFEQSQLAFGVVVSGSATVAVIVAHAFFSFIRGPSMQRRAEERLAEIETFVNALSDMGAVDYTLKRLMNGSGRMNKETFKTLLNDARTSNQASDAEIDLLFRVLDTNKDNELTWRDFYH
jgi:magnesium transporter